MSRQLTIPGLLNARALLVIATLICLCVSSNVGLEFFPLPAATTPVTYTVQAHKTNKASQAPTTEAEGFRVPMMAQSKKRPDEKSLQSHPLILSPTNSCCTQRHLRFATEFSYLPCFESPFTLAPDAGRAPPSSV